MTQVGYHNRFIGAFQEVKRLLDAGAIGTVSHVLAEAYGPVVLKAKGTTWRSRRAEGGGCLYDYAAHPLNLLTWYFGRPVGVSGTVLGRVFSAETDDEVSTTVHFPGAVRRAAVRQLVGRLATEDDDAASPLGGPMDGSTQTDRRCQLYLRDDGDASCRLLRGLERALHH